MSPAVSVLLPLYNAEATVDEALDSLQGQTLVDFEVVAVDDGSGDSTAARFRARAAADPRLRLLTGPHRGLVAALNRGLADCRAPLVARMDGDDRCLPERFLQQVALARQRADIDIIGCRVELFGADEISPGFAAYVAWLNGLVDHEAIVRGLYIESPLVHPSVLFRRDAVRAVGGYQDVGWAEDYDLWLRCAAAGLRFAKVPAVLFQWREHARRLTRTDNRYSVENFLRAKAWYLATGWLRQRPDFVVWGTGQMARRLTKHLQRVGCQPQAFIGAQTGRQAGQLRGVPVVPAADWDWGVGVQALPRVLVALPSRVGRQAARQRLLAAGLVEARDFLCVA
jgi:glycosyltransferase involved in cell wall biosynthesis